MKLIITTVFIFLAAGIHAADFYATSAAEANTLCAAAKAGDRVIMKNGTYTDAFIHFENRNGAAGKPVVFIAETPGKVFFEGNSRLSFSGNYVIIEGFTWQHGGKDLGTKSVIEIKGDHSELRDCAVIDYNNSDASIDNKWVSVYGTYQTVSHCLLKDKRNLGATLTVWLENGAAAHHTISYNYFFGRYNGPNSDNGLESIRIGDSKTSFTDAHCVVAFNRFENCDGEIEIISNKSCHNSYLHNTFFNSDGGLTLRHGNNCLVDGNVFDGGVKQRSYGVRIIGEGHAVVNNYFYHLKGGAAEPFRAPLTIVNGLENTPINGYFPVRRAVVAGNIFVNNVTPDIRLGARSKREGMTIPPDTVLIVNNVLYDDECAGSGVYEALSAAAHVTIAGNTLSGKCLSATEKGFLKLPAAKREGFDVIKDKEGSIVTAAEARYRVTAGTTAGADYTEPAIKALADKKKYSIVTPKDAGPVWWQ